MTSRPTGPQAYPLVTLKTLWWLSAHHDVPAGVVLLLHIRNEVHQVDGLTTLLLYCPAV